MHSYRFARRSFLAGIGGAFGLEALLRNMEAAAQGAGPPPRFLMMHWPVGTIRNQFIPERQRHLLHDLEGGAGPRLHHLALRHAGASPAHDRPARLQHGRHPRRGRRPRGRHRLRDHRRALAGDARQRRRGRRRLRRRSVVGSDPAQERARALPAERPGHDHRQGLLQHDLRQARRLVRDVDALPVVRLRQADHQFGAPGRHDPREQAAPAGDEPAHGLQGSFQRLRAGGHDHRPRGAQAAQAPQERARLLAARARSPEDARPGQRAGKDRQPRRRRAQAGGPAQRADRGPRHDAPAPCRRCRRPRSPARTGSRCGAITRIRGSTRRTRRHTRRWARPTPPSFGPRSPAT